jgi:hypothetical protein
MRGSMKIVVMLTLSVLVTLPASSSTPQATNQDGAPHVAAAPPLKFTFKDINAPGAIETDTYGINNKNMLVGNYIDKNDIPHGMILGGGKKLTSIDCPAGGSTIVYGINSRGTGVADCPSDPGGVIWIWPWPPCCWWPWPVPPPGCPDCPYDSHTINDFQQVVGQWIDKNNLTHGFFVDINKKIFKTLDVPGATATIA